MDFRVPELGEGIETATVVRVLVSAGANVREGQDVVEVETDKATMPLPATSSGAIDRILVKAGDKVRIGSVLMTTVDGKAEVKSEPAQEKTPDAKPSPAKPQAARYEFRVPDLGEGIISGTVIKVAVKPGDIVAVDQAILELETEKATIPLPSPVAGEVEEIRAKAGQVVKVGSVVAILHTTATVPDAPRPAPIPEKARIPAPVAAPSPPSSSLSPETRNGSAQARIIPAGPATRRLARELGVDLAHVFGTARGGRITQDDVKAFVRGLPKGSSGPALSGPAGIAVPPLPDFSKYGPVEKKPFTTLRKSIAKNLALSWTIAPQVTQHELADVTELEIIRKRYADATAKGEPKVTMTVLAVKAVVAALREFPHFNASYDPTAGENGELILKRYLHIGIAVDTERGLVVPVIRDADKKGVLELAKELHDLADKARAGKLTIDEMRGGTFTITNLGGIGGTAFSPIINYPEVAILGLSRSVWQPVVRDGKIEPRLMLPLSLTYDHRVIDGADGARFVVRLAALFADPMRLLLDR